ncbi:MAG TPA: protein DA1, partial [Candidatus Polarisedimenticolia bacterium]|nr:protein DA1 [Candidatus Polarisedimenticolia bacterium]
HEGKLYDQACYDKHLALRCVVCGKVLEGSYSEDYWKNSYHTEHERDTPRCEYCGRFISERLTGGGVQYADGRWICEICRRPAVTGINEANGLMAEVSRHLAKIGLQVDTRPIRLELVGRDRLRTLSGKGQDDLKGFTHYTEQTDGGSVSRTIDVYILYGMPRADSVFALAHELTHVWQNLNGRTDNDESLSEGSCNYAAHLVLQDYPSEYSRFLQESLMASSDPIYGEGFRRVKRFAEERGRSEWLALLKDKNKLPAGY